MDISENVPTIYQVYWYDEVCGFWAGVYVRGIDSLDTAYSKARELKRQGYRVQFVTTTTEVL